MTSRARASSGSTGRFPGAPSAPPSSQSGSRRHTFRPSAMAREWGACESAEPARADTTAVPHGQPPRAMAQATPRARSPSGRPAMAASSPSSRRAAAIRLSASFSRVPGRATPTASARPRGVGRQNRAGRTKANSSNRSQAGKGSVRSRRAVALAWQTRGGGPAPRRRAAWSRARVSISPSGESQAAPRTPATRAGASGRRTGGGSGRRTGGGSGCRTGGPVDGVRAMGEYTAGRRRGQRPGGVGALAGAGSSGPAGFAPQPARWVTAIGGPARRVW